MSLRQRLCVGRGGIKVHEDTQGRIPTLRSTSTISVKRHQLSTSTCCTDNSFRMVRVTVRVILLTGRQWSLSPSPSSLPSLLAPSGAAATAAGREPLDGGGERGGGRHVARHQRLV